MARKPRFTIPGIPQHIIQRGNNRDPCFFAEDDYLRYLEVLGESAQKNGVAVHAYVLMTNHVHLLATPGHEHGIFHMMQDLGRKYVRYINNAYQRSGTLWEGRFKASLVDSQAYLLTCMRYIELNPVRACMVSHPGEYRWSSYACTAAGGVDKLITSHPIYEALDGVVERQRYLYRELFRVHMEDSQIHEIREALSQELVLGRNDFKDRIEQMTCRQARPGKTGRPRVGESSAIYYIV